MTMYPGQLVCMDPGDHAALAAAGHDQGEHTFKVQYEDCTAEVLDLVSMEKIGCPCTELCTLQQDCSRAAPARHHRRKWVLAKHDTEANTQLLLAMESDVSKQPTKRKRQPKGKVPARAPKAATAPTSANDSSSDDDITFAEHMQNASKFRKKSRLRSSRK